MKFKMENKASLHYVGNPKGLGLTSYEKVASTSLTRFFGPHTFENSKWTKMIVVMRTEQDRWVSGFIQDLKLRSSQNPSPYRNFKDFGKGDVLTWDLDRQRYFLDVLSHDGSPYYTPNLFGQNGGHNHLGDTDWQPHIINLIRNKNVWFCELKDLSDYDFWNFCSYTDNSYTNKWNRHNWIEHNNKKHNTNTATDYSNSVSNFKKLVVHYLERNYDDNFGFIHKMLMKNQATIEWIIDSERYYKNYIGDNNVF